MEKNQVLEYHVEFMIEKLKELGYPLIILSAGRTDGENLHGLVTTNSSPKHISSTIRELYKALPDFFKIKVIVELMEGDKE